jgi:hypothetical protein
MLRSKYSFTNNAQGGTGLELRPYSKGVTTMRVFCHEHKRGFLAPRQSPIKCENSGHVLGEIDFNGDAKQVFQTEWQYCCNCEHFCVVNLNSDGLERCPVCTRRSSITYLCERCYTITFESNTPLQTKNFTLTSDGAPRPCCPTCLQPASADLREHTCEDAGASFVTGLTTCPICSERLDIGPTFPSSVAQYLRKTKVADKRYVTFDYETALFVTVEDGEFVVVSNHDEEDRTFLLPRSPRLASLREFYELYQDYYLCVNPDTGEINISEPAVVVPTTDGWKLLKTGRFETVGQPRRVEAAALAVQPKREEPRPTRVIEEAATPCANCNTPVEEKYAFCWKCGHPRGEIAQSPPKHRAHGSRLILQAVEADEEEQTVQRDDRSSAPASRYSSLLSSAKKRPRRANGSVLRIFGVGVGGALLLTLSLFTLTRSRATDVTAAQPAAAPAVQSAPTPTASTTVEMKQASLSVPEASAEETALARLRQMRNSTDTSKVLKNLSASEKQFSDDYRFPYERARIVVKNNLKNFHTAAFAALARAAQKAINKGKTGEMLQSLKTDGSGDFQKLVQSQREWKQLQKALRSKDVSVLEEGQGF